MMERMRVGTIALFLVTAVVAALVPAAGSGATSAATAGATEWVVQVRPGADLEGLHVVDAIPGADYVLVRSQGPPEHPAVIEARPPVTARAAAVPDDPLYERQWHLHAVGADLAWEISTGAGVVVAVLDTGVAFEDFGPYERAPDLNTTSFVAGWDFVNGDAHANDDNGHGTHVAAVIAQSTNNSLGGAGVAPGARIMPVKVLDDKGEGTDFDIASGVRWAADRGAQVLNISIASDTESAVLADAIRYAWNKGITIVVAAGNEGGTIAFPAVLPEVIAVGAVRIDATRPAYSNFGPELDVMAPGGDFTVDQDNDGRDDGILQESFIDGPTDFCYCMYEGTSMSAPLVSGIVALLIAQGFATTPEVVRRVLQDTAADLGPPGRDDAYGHGLVYAPVALEAATEEFRTFRTFSSTARPSDDSCPASGVPEDGFADVLDTSPHEPFVDCVVWWGVAAGRSPGVYDPTTPVTRAQMATFLARVLAVSNVALPQGAPNAFTDDEGSPHEAAIDQLAALELVGGTGPGTFSPEVAVRRDQMATFLVRVAELLAGTLGPASGDRFGDDDTSAHEASVELAAELGLVAGTGAGVYAPDRSVRRDQMASFLARTLDLLTEAGVTTLPAA
jgi:hypothetical protein